MSLRAFPRMNTVFWCVVALDALLFLVLLVMTLQSGGPNDGGREMGLFFFITVPSAVLGLAVLLFVLCDGVVWRSLALLIAAGPGLFIGGGQARSLWIDRVIAERAQGAWYYSGKAMQAMGRAVVQRDVDTLRKLGSSVDVNTVGERGMTLLAQAAEQADAEPAGPTPPSALQVAQVLLALGAKPGPAMETAVKLKDPALLRALLDAGGNPNMPASNGQPLVFSWISVMPLETLRLLAERGLDLNARFYGDPLAFVVTVHRRHDLLALLIERRADVGRPRGDGRTAAGEVESQIAEALKAGEAIPPALLQAKAMLDARAAKARSP